MFVCLSYQNEVRKQSTTKPTINMLLNPHVVLLAILGMWEKNGEFLALQDACWKLGQGWIEVPGIGHSVCSRSFLCCFFFASVVCLQQNKSKVPAFSCKECSTEAPVDLPHFTTGQRENRLPICVHQF